MSFQRGQVFRSSRASTSVWGSWFYKHQVPTGPKTDCLSAERTLVVGAHPAIHSVAAQAAAIQVRRLDSFKRIRRQGFALRLYIYLVKLRGVEPEDLRLILFGELLVTKLFTHLIGHLEALEGVDAPLRRAPPQAISPPDYVIRAIVLDVLAQAMRRHHRIDHRERVEETAELAVDVVHLWVALFDIHQNVVPEKIAGCWIVLVALF